MKYKIANQEIPQAKRKAINEKILYLIENNITEQHNITNEVIFNSYTGEGGLHGLEFKDYSSFHSFTEAKKEIENGQFFTPHSICKFIIDCVKPSYHDIVSDLTSGMGNFFNYLPNLSNVYSNEIDIKAYKIQKQLYPEINLTADDIRQYEPNIKFDIILGNPPYNLKWQAGKNEYLSQLYYCIKSFELLKPAGVMALIMPSSFLNDEFSDGGMIKEVNKMFNFIYQCEIPSNSFRNVGVENFQTKIMFFQKKSEHITDGKPYSIQKDYISDINEINSQSIFNTYIQPVMSQKEKVKHKLFHENIQSNSEDIEFQDKVKKLLFDIKRNPKINQHYSKCTEYVNKFYNQKPPEGMKWEEWEKIRVTKTKVISYLSKLIKNQFTKEIDKIELVKTNYGLKLKGYSQKNKIYLSKLQSVKSETFTNMIINSDYPFADKKYKKLFNKKQSNYIKQSESFINMRQNEKIEKFLSDLTIYDYEEDETIKLNDTQKTDTNKLLQKDHGFLQWGQGSGKSISGIAQLRYRLENKQVKNVFVVSTAIAINNTWNEILNNYKYDYIRINKLCDINNIKSGQIVIISLNILSKYERFVKKYIKQQSKKVMLLLDESDSISNPHSKRTKSVLNCFRKVKYKTLLTGTMTRNTIAEASTQFELMYNNSVNMLSENRYVYKMDKDDKTKLNETINEYYMKPIPAYNKGYRLFSESHIPQKITVFGVGQYTQDIYNAEELKRLIDKTVITRTFEEVTGRKIYEIKQNTCKFNVAETALYTKVIEDFHSMSHLFAKTGNLRKDRMLEILNQLMLMLKVCSIPHTFDEYIGSGTPTKIKNVMNMLDNWQGERVAIGVRHIKTVAAYAYEIRKRFPDRPLFIITGDKVSLNKRKAIVKDLKASTNGILLSTQQSLSSSVNIGFVNKVIVPELSWNDASMSQYYFRFIRLNSVDNNKEVHFITYENSIESNLLGLILAKEKLNLFMKNQEINDEELYDKFGIEFNLLDMLMRKEKDEDGRTQIRWGKQNIS